MLEILASVFSFLAVMAKSTRHDNSLDTDMAAIQKLHETDMAAAKINNSLL